MKEQHSLNIVIVGAGIAGLTAAIALGKQGHRVVIVEKSRFNKETGAAINLAPNCTAVLEWLHIDPRDFGATLLEEVRRYDHHGTLKYGQEFGDIRRFWQAGYYLVHRADLHGALKARALKAAELHTGCNIIDIDISTDRPSVTLDDGRVFEGDLLIGADGLNSIVRKAIAPEAAAPYPGEKSCFRWLLPANELRRLDTTQHAVKPGVFIEWEALKTRLVMYPCSDNKVLNMCAFVPTAQAGEHGEGWEATGNKGALVHAFADFCPAVREFVERAGEDLKVWQLYDMESLPQWAHGRAVVIGDAAHPFQPYLGQGGAMAIEDAVALAILLPSGTSIEDIPGRLRLYETARRPRVEEVLDYTRRNARDGDDLSGGRISPSQMIEFMTTTMSHNEVTHSTAILDGCV
ncbi:hypothetical protein BJX63DRAFT_328766 [Aspergillus granulosus]|uniref:FAD-binding domain-containing protein n=1 Tax=Aspergillus granulosus TaxID=176169 RepID=A0ABR4H3Z9_9EURO